MAPAYAAAQAAARGIMVTPYVVEIAFDNLKDPSEREFVNNVKTSFNLDDETVDRLIEAAVGCCASLRSTADSWPR